MAVDRLDAHFLHKRGNVQPSSFQPFRFQKPLQHPASREWIVEMQLIDPPHRGKIAFRHRTRQIVDAATAEAEKLDLAYNGKLVMTVDHFFSPGNAALPSAPDKKSFSSASSPILA